VIMMNSIRVTGCCLEQLALTRWPHLSSRLQVVGVRVRRPLFDKASASNMITARRYSRSGWRRVVERHRLIPGKV
jgi:hypothetical protein